MSLDISFTDTDVVLSLNDGADDVEYNVVFADDNLSFDIAFTGSGGV